MGLLQVLNYYKTTIKNGNILVVYIPITGKGETVVDKIIQVFNLEITCLLAGVLQMSWVTSWKAAHYTHIYDSMLTDHEFYHEEYNQFIKFYQDNKQKSSSFK